MKRPRAGSLFLLLTPYVPGSRPASFRVGSDRPVPATQTSRSPGAITCPPCLSARSLPFLAVGAHGSSTVLRGTWDAPAVVMKTLRAWITIALVPAGAALTACPGPSPTVETDGALAGAWSPYSATIYYDAGGGGAFQGGSYSLTLSDSGTWSYGSSSGSWAG